MRTHFTIFLTRVFCAVLFSSLAFSADISGTDVSGTWKHAKIPVWVEIRLDQGDGIVVRNDKFPERVGKVFVKDIKADTSKQALWHGTAFIRKLEDFKDVEISLSEAGNMQVKGKVGFFSHTVEWLRVDSLSAH